MDPYRHEAIAWANQSQWRDFGEFPALRLRIEIYDFQNKSMTRLQNMACILHLFLIFEIVQTNFCIVCVLRRQVISRYDIDYA